MSIEPTPSNEEPEVHFRPLSRHQRRVVGVLIEKSKTTPNAYPMTVNAITTGANQKSNRSPQMTIAADDVQVYLDELRELKAVVEIHGDGRTVKYKHRMYQWLGVEKVEMAVMGELLLRGEQTLGDLRARASRMEPISRLDELKPIVQSLIEKNLVVELTPKGRGQIVTHNLYLEHEMDKLKSLVGSGSLNDDLAVASPIPASVPQRPAGSTVQESEILKEIADLKEMVELLSERVDQLEKDS